MFPNVSFNINLVHWVENLRVLTNNLEKLNGFLCWQLMTDVVYCIDSLLNVAEYEYCPDSVIVWWNANFAFTLPLLICTDNKFVILGVVSLSGTMPNGIFLYIWVKSWNKLSLMKLRQNMCKLRSNGNDRSDELLVCWTAHVLYCSL
jgi:uncharacterized membrane protein